MIILLALSTALTVVILNLHCRGNYKIHVPRWVRILVLHWFARMVCMKSLVDTALEDDNVSLMSDYISYQL